MDCATPQTGTFYVFPHLLEDRVFARETSASRLPIGPTVFGMEMVTSSGF